MPYGTVSPTRSRPEANDQSAGSRDARRSPGVEFEYVEQRLKQLIKRLGSAIDDSLSHSEVIADVIGQIREEGYDVLLVLEATIGFNKRADKAGQASSPELTHKDLDKSLTEEDQQFLRALSIRLDE